MRFSEFIKQYKQKMVCQSMDASGTPVTDVINVPDSLPNNNSGFDLSTKDIPDLLKAVPVSAKRDKKKNVITVAKRIFAHGS